MLASSPRGLRRTRPEVPSASLRGHGGPRARDPDLGQRGAQRSGPPRLLVFWRPRPGQDDRGPHLGEVSGLRRGPDRRTLQPLLSVRGDQRGDVGGRRGDRRSEQQLRREHPWAEGAGRVPAPVRAPQDLHHRRGPHADHVGLQRPAQDVGGAPAPRELSVRDHGAPKGPADHLVPGLATGSSPAFGTTAGGPPPEHPGAGGHGHGRWRP